MGDDLSTTYMYCDTCGKLKPEDEMSIDFQTGHGTCDECAYAKPGESEPKAA